MKITACIFLVYIIAFSSTSFIVTMDPTTQDLTTNLKNEFCDQVKKLTNSNPSIKTITKTYHNIEKIIQKCPSKEDKEQLLSYPLNNKELRLIHIIAQLSTQVPNELSDKKSLTLNSLYQFFNLLLQHNMPINIQDSDGNTPLLCAFAEKEDDIIAWSPDIVALLLYYQAHPLIKNKKGVNPQNYLEKILQARYRPDYSPKDVVSEMNISSIEQALYHYK